MLSRLIGAYFLAVSSHKRGRLNTSVYGNSDLANLVMLGPNVQSNHKPIIYSSVYHIVDMVILISLVAV